MSCSFSTVVWISTMSTLLLAARFRNGGTALFAQGNREAVAGNRNQTQLHNGNILHQKSLLLNDSDSGCTYS